MQEMRMREVGMPGGKGKSGGRSGYGQKGRVKTGPPRDRRLRKNRGSMKKGK